MLLSLIGHEVHVPASTHHISIALSAAAAPKSTRGARKITHRHLGSKKGDALQYGGLLAVYDVNEPSLVDTVC